MKEKFKDYQQVYLFGKDRNIEVPEVSLREKRKNKTMMPAEYEGQKIIEIDEELRQLKVGDAFERFKSDDHLLVVVVSSDKLQQP